MGDTASCIGGNSLWQSGTGAGIFPGALRAFCACVRVCLPAYLPGEYYRTLRERRGFMYYACCIAACCLCGIDGHLAVARRSIAGTVILCGICQLFCQWQCQYDAGNLALPVR